MKQTSSRPVSVSDPSSSGPWRVRLVPRPASRFSVCGSEGVLGPPHSASFWSELSLCTWVLALQQGGQRGGGSPLQAARHLLGLACPPVPDTHPPFRRTQGPPYCMFRPRPAAGQGEDVLSAPTCPSSCSPLQEAPCLSELPCPASHFACHSPSLALPLGCRTGKGRQEARVVS